MSNQICYLLITVLTIIGALLSYDFTSCILIGMMGITAILTTWYKFDQGG